MLITCPGAGCSQAWTTRLRGQVANMDEVPPLLAISQTPARAIVQQGDAATSRVGVRQRLPRPIRVEES